MKIRQKLLFGYLSAVVLIALLGLLGVRYSTQIAATFSHVQSNDIPALVALIEQKSSARQASIHAMEYSMHGKQRDRLKAQEALGKLNRHNRLFQQSDSQTDEKVKKNLDSRILEFTQAIESYLSTTAGPSSKALVEREENIHQARMLLLESLQAYGQDSSQAVDKGFLLIKNNTRKITLKAFEYSLRGEDKDRQAALGLIEVFLQDLKRLLLLVNNDEVLKKNIFKHADVYMQQTRDYLDAVSERNIPAGAIYKEEEKLHRTRKALIHTLYDRIAEHTQQLDVSANTARATVLDAKIILYSSVVVAVVIALLTGLRIARSISSPIVKLTDAVREIGHGNLKPVVTTTAADEMGALAESFNQMLADLTAKDEELRLSEEKFSKAFNASPDAIMITRLDDGCIIDVNEGFIRSTGYQSEEVLNKTTIEMNLWAFPAQREDVIKLLSEQGNLRDYELGIRIKSGEVRTCLMSVDLTDIHGEPHLVSSVRDVTDLKRAELSLEHSRAEFEAMFNSISDAVIFADQDRKVAMINKAAEKLFGYEPAEVIGKFTRVFYSDDNDFDEQGRVRFNVNANGRSDVYELLYQRKDATTFPGETIGSIVKDADGNILGFIGVVRDISDRKKAELAIQESRAMLQLVLDSIPVRVFWKDADLKYLGCNRNFAMDAGLDSPEQIIGKTDFELSWHEQAELYRVDDRQVMQSGESKLNYEEPQTWPDGTALVLRTSKIPLFDRNDNIVGVLGTYEDITRRKQASKQIEYQAKILEQIRDSVIATDLDGYLTSWNKGAERMFGFTADEMLGKHISSVYPEEELPHLQGLINELQKRGNYETEVRMRRKDGEDFFANLSLSMSYDEQGTPVGMIGYSLDITDRKQAEDALKKSEREVRTILDDMTDTFYRTDKDGKIQMVSRSVFDLLGYRPEELIGTRMSELYLHAGQRQHFLELLRSNHGVVINYEAQLRHKNGAEIWVSTNAHYSHDADGNIAGVEGVTRDISIQKQSREQLEQMVKVRTDDLARAKEVAEKANQAKSAFLSRMSHELRTPLNAILGFAQVLQMEGMNASQQSSLDEIQVAGKHLLELINEVLDLARIESGTIDLVITAVIVAEVLEECAILIEPKLRERSILLQFDDIDQGCAVVQADPVRLKEVLLNLISNAVKYNVSGGKITVHCDKTDSNMIRINVTDTGPGIPVERQDELFEAFNRLDAENTEIEGTGIGLVIAKDLIEMMGGEIGVISEPGRGSTFWIEVPVSDLDNVTTDDKRTSAPTASAAAMVEEKSVIYIEDNPANLRLVSQLLSKRPNINLLTAYTPELGLELIYKNLPDLVLLDINLPGMSGFEVLQQLKQHHETRHIPVIAISANAQPEDMKQGVSSGFDGYLTKPFDVDHFYALVDRVLLGGSARIE